MRRLVLARPLTFVESTSPRRDHTYPAGTPVRTHLPKDLLDRHGKDMWKRHLDRHRKDPEARRRLLVSIKGSAHLRFLASDDVQPIEGWTLTLEKDE